MIHLKLFTLLVLFVPSHLFAQYISALPNHNLKEELLLQKDRKIIVNDWFSAAADGNVYARGLGTHSFYHGVGHWTQLRTESRVSNYFQLNTRSILFTGSNSSGYSKENHSYHLFSFNAQLPLQNKDFKLYVRARDLERVTIGRGLIIQEREFVGLLLGADYKNIKLKIVKEGTSGFNINGDLSYLEVSNTNENIGAGIAIWQDDNTENNVGEIAKNYHYIFSKIYLHNNLYFETEIGVQNTKLAYLGSLAFKNDFINTKIQYRHYEPDFMNEFVGNMSSLYTSLDQLNIAYTNPANILGLSNNVDVIALMFNFVIPVNDYLSFDFQNEIGMFKYKLYLNHDYYFYRAAIKYRPLVEYSSYLSFYISNKVINDSYATPPSNYSYFNEVKFIKKSFFGIDLKFRF